MNNTLCNKRLKSSENTLKILISEYVPGCNIKCFCMYVFLKKKANSNLKKVCLSVYGVELFQKMYDVIKLCDKLEMLKRQSCSRVILLCKY